MNPRYPIYVPSKGRSKYGHTMKAFNRMNVPYKIVVEPQDYDDYASAFGKEKLIVTPHRDKGLTHTRNFIWDHAQESGTPYFWTFDDNISHFYRLNHNIKWYLKSGTGFYVIEEFMQRYENIAICGMQYEMFCPRKAEHPPFILNTRVYSNMLIRTDIPYRNECFYNDDTDLCLRVLKDGWVTVLFYAFLAQKITTMIIPGGMTTYYKSDGRLKFAEELQQKHPDCVTITWIYNRWHHQVNYTKFKKNKLKFKAGVKPANRINNFGMILKTLD